MECKERISLLLELRSGLSEVLRMLSLGSFSTHPGMSSSTAILCRDIKDVSPSRGDFASFSGSSLASDGDRIGHCDTPRTSLGKHTKCVGLADECDKVVS